MIIVNENQLNPAIYCEDCQQLTEIYCMGYVKERCYVQIEEVPSGEGEVSLSASYGTEPGDPFLDKVDIYCRECDRTQASLPLEEAKAFITRKNREAMDSQVRERIGRVKP